MKIVCAPDKFKECLPAREVAQALAAGIRTADPAASVDLCPIADGGEGTVEALLAATGGQAMTSRVTGPLGEPVDARWGLLGRRPGDPLTAVIEMASAAGLGLVPSDRRDPTRTTTYGVGELIRHALAAGARRIIVGIGGSATTDGGAAMAQALGVRFFDRANKLIDRPLCGGMLPEIARIDLYTLDRRIEPVQIVVASDVTNPLTGPSGAAAVYGPQKGATPEQVKSLDAGLGHLASRLREDCGRDIASLPGSGAAGGLGGGLIGFLGATLRPGIDLVLEAVHFDERIAGADLCLTGEGRLDGQSLAGKACLGVARIAGRHGVPTVALVGSAADDAHLTLQAGLESFHVIGQGLSKEESIRRAAELLSSHAREVVCGRAAQGGRRP